MLTSKDIAAVAASGEDDGIVGTAACLGGITLPDMAFDDHGQKIAGHELGHLLHHCDNCAEGSPTRGRSRSSRAA